jgi:hypothetical protein
MMWLLCVPVGAVWFGAILVRRQCVARAPGINITRPSEPWRAQSLLLFRRSAPYPNVPMASPYRYVNGRRASIGYDGRLSQALCRKQSKKKHTGFVVNAIVDPRTLLTRAVYILDQVRQILAAAQPALGHDRVAYNQLHGTYCSEHEYTCSRHLFASIGGLGRSDSVGLIKARAGPRSIRPRSTRPRSTRTRSTRPRSTRPRSTRPRSTRPRSRASTQRSAWSIISASTRSNTRLERPVIIAKTTTKT